MPNPTSPPLSATNRRRRKLERQLHALYAMRGHLTTKDIVYAVLTIPGVAILCLLVAAKLHWLSGSLAIAVAGALLAGFIVWLVGRHWLVIAWLIVIALICILLEDIPTFGGGDDPNRKPKKEKMDRRKKLELAITRREELLRPMGGTAPGRGPAS